MSEQIRDCALEDAPALAAIYNHYILHSVATFEEVPIPEAEMGRRVREVTIDGDLPWLVLERAGEVMGYAYGHPWHPRSAYRHSVESSIYLRPDATGAGLGTRLYTALLERLAERPLHRVMGGISLPNAASVALHERLGFRPCGQFSEVGRKFGRWIDVGYWSRPLVDVYAVTEAPPGPRPAPHWRGGGPPG